MAPREKATAIKHSRVIYQFKCTKAGCKEKYIRESGRTYWNRLREHLRAPFPFTNTASLQDIPSMWAAFPLWAGKHTVLPGPSRRPCLYESNDPSLNRNQGSIGCPTSGMKSYRTPWPSTLGNLSPRPQNGPTPWHYGVHIHILHIGKYGPSPGGCQFPPF